MRHILAMAVLGASLTFTASAALAHDSAGIPQRSWDGGTVQAQKVVLYNAPNTTAGGPLSEVTGPGTDDGYNPYRPNPGGGGFSN